MIITTIHGTKFRINHKNKTWERIDSTGDSGNLRTESGTFISANLNDYGGYTIICPPITEGSMARAIITSPVVLVRED